MSDRTLPPPDDGEPIDNDVSIGNKRTEIPWGATLMTCPGCSSANVEIVEAEVCPWTHDDGRLALDIGLLARCHRCDDTFRLTMFSRGAQPKSACILMEHWMSKGVWS